MYSSNKEVNLYIIAGPNGAGKSTNAHKILPPGLSSFDFDKTLIDFYKADKFDHELRFDMAHRKAEELFLSEIKSALENKNNYAYETNFFTDNCMHWPKKFKKKGFKTNLLFIATDSIDTSRLRVEQRVKVKGHPVPMNQIEERHKGSLDNVNRHFKDFDNFTLIDGTKDLKPILQIDKGKVIGMSNDIPEYIKTLYKPIFKHIEKSKDKVIKF